MKKRIIKKVCISALLCAILIFAGPFVQIVNAYEYAKTGATKSGTVTIQEVPASKSVNGYSLLDGYLVKYSVTNNNWVAFDKSNGCDFYIGNTLKESGGCHFVYKPDGTIYQQGALALGAIKDGKSVGSCEPNSNGTVQVSFSVKNLSDLPDYIGYTYQPAAGAYLHMTESYGHNYHVWYYQKLTGVTPKKSSSIDTSAPSLSVSVAAGGKTAVVNGKTWGTSAVINAAASDSQSRPAGVRFLKGGGVVQNCANTSNAATFTGQYTVGANATYQVNAYDQLGNTTANQDIVVNCIDTDAPSISALTADNTAYCTSLVLRASAADSGSGLNAKPYSFNGGEWSASNSLSVTENGTYALRVQDAVGNVSAKSITIENIDTDVPRLSVEKNAIGEEITVGNNIWSKEREIHIEAYDEKSGIKEATIMDDDGNKVISKASDEAEDGKLCFDSGALSAGHYMVLACDMLGNTAKEELVIDFVDDTPPDIIDVEQTVVNDKCVRITIEAEDNEDGSGLAGSAYSFDGGSTWQEENYIDVNKNKTYSLVVRDNMGLQDQVNEVVKSIKDINTGSSTGKNNKDKDKTTNNKNKDKTTNSKKKGTGSKDKGSNGQNGNGQGDGGQGGSGQNNGGQNGSGQSGSGQNNGGQGGSGQNGSGQSNGGQGTGRDAASSRNSSTKETEQSSALNKESDANRNGFEEKSSLRSVDGNGISDNTLKEVVTNALDKSYDSRKEEMEQLNSKAEERQKAVKKIATVALVTVLIIGLLALGAYFLLTYLYRSCVLYALDENKHQKKLCRLPVTAYSGDWLVEVPGHQLGTFGNGRYLLVFHPSFVKENGSDYVVITIDRNRIREKLREEIEIHI